MMDVVMISGEMMSIVCDGWVDGMNVLMYLIVLITKRIVTICVCLLLLCVVNVVVVLLLLCLIRQSHTQNE